MKKIQPFDTRDNFTRIHNYVIDTIMPELKPNAFKLLMFIIRKTKGWGKDADRLSYSQLREGTGMKSDATLAAAIDELVSMRYISVENDEKWLANNYVLNTTLEIEVDNCSTTEIEATTVFEVEPTTVFEVEPTTETVDTKETVKEKERKHSADKPQQKSARKKNSGEQSNPVVKEILAAYVEVRGKNGINYGKEGAWAKKIANEQPENGDAVVLVKGCYQWLKAQDFWKFKPVGMATIYEYMEEYKRYTQHSKAQQAKQQPKKVVIINQFTGQTEEKIIQ